MIERRAFPTTDRPELRSILMNQIKLKMKSRPEPLVPRAVGLRRLNAECIDTLLAHLHSKVVTHTCETSDFLPQKALKKQTRTLLPILRLRSQEGFRHSTM